MDTSGKIFSRNLAGCSGVFFYGLTLSRPSPGKRKTMKTTKSVLVLLLGLLLVACAETSQPTPQQPTALHVLRPASQFPIYGQPFPRLERTINDANAVQQLYAAALALPVVDKGKTYHCPVDFGVVYRLDFLAGSNLLQHMDVQASGCRWVHLSSTDTRWTTDAFNRLLANMMGIPSLLPVTPKLTQQYDFTEQDRGRTLIYTVTTRFQIIFNQQQYPKKNLQLSCTPPGVLGSISNLPSVTPPLYAVRYEAVQPGLCTIKNGTFLLTVRIIALNE